MSKQSVGDAGERQWAKAHFHDYLLHRLGPEEEDRVIAALATIPGLADDLEAAEEGLIETWLERRLAAGDLREFERWYVNGSEAARAKLEVHRALRSAQLRREFRPVRPAPIRMPSRPHRPVAWAAAIAASLLAGVSTLFLYQQVRQNSRMESELAELRTQPNAAFGRALVPEPQERRNPGRQAAQQASPVLREGFMLAANESGTAYTVAAAPGRLIWSPAPDDRSPYLIRVRSANGHEQTSPPLTPRDGAVEYPLARNVRLPLPWTVLILRAGGDREEVLAQYTLGRP
jgi:hypothetical protein